MTTGVVPSVNIKLNRKEVDLMLWALLSGCMLAVDKPAFKHQLDALRGLHDYIWTKHEEHEALHGQPSGAVSRKDNVSPKGMPVNARARVQREGMVLGANG